MRREVSPEEAVEFALARFAPLRDGKTSTTFDDLSSRFNRERGVIEDGIKNAFLNRWVELKSNMPPTIETADELEAKIVESFARRATVVRPGRVPTNEDGSDEWRRFDDDVHRRVGYALGSSLLRWQIGHGARIGFGSGRGVYYTVEAAMGLGRPNYVQPTGVHLVSLTGSIGARDYQNRVNARMDADFRVGLFGSFLAHTATLHLVYYPISERGQLQMTCLGREHWPHHNPSHAVVGIGVLAEGHRFWEQAQQWEKAQKEEQSGRASPLLNPIFDKIIVKLNELVKLCKRVYEDYGHHSVADICNHLFVVNHPSVPLALEDQIAALKDQVNGLLLNVNLDQLRDIPHLMIVAAGARKARALCKVLRSPNFHVDHICIDQTLAEELLRVADEPVPKKKLGPPVPNGPKAPRR